MVRSWETVPTDVCRRARHTGRVCKSIRKWLCTNVLLKPVKRNCPNMLDPFQFFILEQSPRGVTDDSKMLYLLQQGG